MLVSEDYRWEAGYWVILKKKRKLILLKRRRKGVGLAGMGNAKVGS